MAVWEGAALDLPNPFCWRYFAFTGISDQDSIPTFLSKIENIGLGYKQSSCKSLTIHLKLHLYCSEFGPYKGQESTY